MRDQPVGKPGGSERLDEGDGIGASERRDGQTMMTYLWVYDGALDPTGRVLTLEAAGPRDPTGKTARYRDVITLMGDDCRELTSYQLRDGGTWHAFMTATYWRKA